MTTEQTINFMSDTYQLTGTLHLPATFKPAVVIGCHGLFANRNSPKQIELAHACNRQGLAYFRFDHRGCGDSQGDFIKATTLKSRCRDLYQSIATMSAHPAVGPLTALFGSSFGGTVVLAHAAEYASPALITYAAPINSTSIKHANIRDNSGQMPASAMLTDALEFNITPRLKSIQNIMIAHCEGDETVPVAHAHQIHRQSQKAKKLVIFKGGDHVMSNPVHQQQFENKFIDWIISLAL